jgi:hypothetical protein
MNIRGTSLTAAAFVAAAAATIGFAAPAAGQSGDLSAGSSNLSSGSGDLSSGSGSACFNRDVTPAFQWGWRTPDPDTSFPPVFVEGPESVSGNRTGRGSIDMTTSAARTVVDYFQPGNATPLATVAGAEFGLSYKYAANGQFGPTYQLRMRGMTPTGGTDDFTTLYWAPENNGGFTPNTWTQASNLATGNWISTRAIADQPLGTARTLAAISQSNPGGYVLDYGVLFGSSAGNITQGAWVDTLGFGCAQWNFEPGLFAGSSGSAGSSGIGSSGS